MKLVIAADHAAVSLKDALVARLSADHEVLDAGTHGTESVDYPVFAQRAARILLEGRVERGILLCGTGIGMAIAANKLPGIRASVAHDNFSVQAAVAHNDLNMLALGARVIGAGLAWELVQTFLAARFEGGRHQRRLDQISILESGGTLDIS